jgi:hypothetical protein
VRSYGQGYVAGLGGTSGSGEGYPEGSQKRQELAGNLNDVELAAFTSRIGWPEEQSARRQA